MMCERCGLEILTHEPRHRVHNTEIGGVAVEHPNTYCIFRLKAEVERLHDSYGASFNASVGPMSEEIESLRSQLADRDKLLGECLSILEFHSSGQASDIGNRIQSTLDGKPKHPCWKCGGSPFTPRGPIHQCPTCHGTGEA